MDTAYEGSQSKAKSCLYEESTCVAEAIKIVRGSVDGDTFYNFVCTSLNIMNHRIHALYEF